MDIIYSQEYFDIPEREDLEAGCNCKLNVTDCESWIIASFLKAFKNNSGILEMYKDKTLKYDQLLPYLYKTEFSKDEIRELNRELNKVIFDIDSIQEVIKLFIKTLKSNKKRVKKLDIESFDLLFKSIPEANRDKKISPEFSVNFFLSFDSLDINKIQLIT